jgi:soluble lytic murein transglycosylase-like protein
VSLRDRSAIKFRFLRRQLVIGASAAAALITAAALTRPVFLGRSEPVRALLDQRLVDVMARAPWLNMPTAAAVSTPQFLLDRQAFVTDLLRTGKVTSARAWEIADVAVREAYRRRVPPALVLGVMLTENDELKSTARSRVGAIGLMQVHPRPWKNLRKLFGSNLKTDSTNLKYGIFILGHVAGEAGKNAATLESGWRSALLRYNGCSRGTNTPDCHRYPDVVRRNVVRSARYSCGAMDFNTCVAHPLWLAKNDRGDLP